MSVRDRLKQLASESAIYGLAPIVQRLISVFLTPLYTRVFTPGDYGTMSLVDSTMGLLAPLAVLALDSAAFRWFYDAQTDEARKQAVGTWFWTQLCFATVLAVGVALVPDGVLAGLTDRPDARVLFLAAAAGLPLMAFETVAVNHARMHRRPWRALAIMLFSSVSTVALTLLLVIGMRRGLLGIYLATLTTRALLAVASIRLVGDWLSPARARLSLLRSMLRYSLPMVPTALFSWTIAVADRYFVASYWNPAEVGLYSIGVAIGSILTLFTGAFQNAWSAFAFSIKDTPEAPRTYALVLELFLSGACFLALGIALFAPEALRLLTNPRYYAAENVVALIAVGYVMAGAFQITGLGAMLARNTRPLLEAFALAAALNIALNFALIPPYGRLGAAGATLLAQSVLALYLLWRSQGIHHIPYRSWLLVALPVATMLVAFGARAMLPALSLPLAVAAKLAIATAFGAMLAALSSARPQLVARLGFARRRAA